MRRISSKMVPVQGRNITTHSSFNPQRPGRFGFMAQTANGANNTGLFIVHKSAGNSFTVYLGAPGAASFLFHDGLAVAAGGHGGRIVPGGGKRPFFRHSGLRWRVQWSPLFVRELPLQVRKLPLRVKSSPHLVRKVPLQVKRLPLLVRSLPHQVKSSPLFVRKVPLRVKRIPLLVRRLPHQVKALPLMVERPLAPCSCDATPGCGPGTPGGSLPACRHIHLWPNGPAWPLPGRDPVTIYIFVGSF